MAEPRFHNLQKVPPETDKKGMYRWMYKICEILNGATFFPFNIAPPASAVPTLEGTLSWNTEHHTLNIQPNDPSVLFQVGMEDVAHVYNPTATDIPNGQLVYISGIDTDHPAVMLAKANTRVTSVVMGMTTNVIPSMGYGFVTSRGDIHGYDTTGFTSGEIVYLSDTTAGDLTNIIPIAPSYSIPVGTIILGGSTAGIIQINIGDPALAIVVQEAAISSKDPTGFTDANSVIDIAYDSTARTITLTGNLEYYWRGTELYLGDGATWTSSAHSATTGVSYFLYSADGRTFSWSTTSWLFSDVQLAVVYYGPTNKFGIRETHGLMPHDTHEEFHTVVGSYKRSGFALGTYVAGSTTAANRRPSIATGITKDEDLATTYTALPTGAYTTGYLTTTAITTFTTGYAEIVPVLVANPYWNNGITTPGTWVQTLMVNNSYMSVWLVAAPVTSDATSQAYRFFWLQGQTNGTLAAEQVLTPANLELGNLKDKFTEFVFLSQIIIRFTAGNWTITSVKDLTRRVGL